LFGSAFWSKYALQGLVLRVCFVLGNLTGHSADNRQKIIHNCQAIDILLPLLVKYNQIDISSQADPEGASANQENEQVLVKVVKLGDNVCWKHPLIMIFLQLIRLLANLAISPELGPFIASSDGIQVLCHLLGTPFNLLLLFCYSPDGFWAVVAEYNVMLMLLFREEVHWSEWRACFERSGRNYKSFLLLLYWKQFDTEVPAESFTR
jgi:hypothetical protein